MKSSTPQYLVRDPQDDIAESVRTYTEANTQANTLCEPVFYISGA